MIFPVDIKLGGFGVFDAETFDVNQMIKDLKMFKYEHGGSGDVITGKELGDLIFRVNRHQHE